MTRAAKPAAPKPVKRNQGSDAARHPAATRLTDAQEAALVALAARLGVTRSEALREAVVRGIEAMGGRP